MKFKIMRSPFLEGLKSVQNIVVNKGALAILQNVLVEARGRELVMTTTDLDISIKARCECEVEMAGSTTIPVKLLFNAISKVADGEIEVDTDAKDRTTIHAGNAKFTFAGVPVSDFPKLPKEEESFAYTLPQAVFKDMLRKVSYAVTQDDTRRALKGVLLSFKDQKLKMVATDGRRLALVEQEVEFPCDEENDIIIPSKAVTELQRSLVGDSDISIKKQNSQICFKVDDLMIYSKLIDEKYPNYEQVIPKDTKEHIAVDREMLLNALDRASVLTQSVNSTKLIFSEGKLTVSSTASDIGEAKDEVPIKYAGEKIEILFNPVYMMECLKAIDDDEVIVNITDGHLPAVIKCSIPFIYVLMPLRVS